MKNLNLSAIISGYKTVLENLPDESTYDYPAINVDYNYGDTLDAAFESMHNVLSALLQTQEFAFVSHTGGEYVKFFNTVEERDSFVDDETFTRSNKATCIPITYDEFLSYVQGDESVLSCYFSNTADGCVDFCLRGFYTEEDAEE